MDRRAWVAVLVLAAGCGGGHDFPRDPPPTLQLNVAVYAGTAPLSARVEVRDAAGNPVPGAQVWLLDGDADIPTTEYPAGSGTYRIVPGARHYRARYGVVVDAGGRGSIRTSIYPGPQIHEVLAPQTYRSYDVAGGLAVSWTPSGASAARVRLSHNDYDETMPDHGAVVIPRARIPDSTSWEYVEVDRSNDFGLEGALPGSLIHIEVEETTGPFSVSS